LHSKSRSDTRRQGVSDQATQGKKYTIGEVAKITGSTVKTVRYYDEIGLLKPAEVTASRYRLYTMEEIWRLELIFTFRYLGFGIDEINKMISGEKSVANVINWQIEALDAQIRTLTRIKSILLQTQQSNYKEDSLRLLYKLIASPETCGTEEA